MALVLAATAAAAAAGRASPRSSGSFVTFCPPDNPAASGHCGGSAGRSGVVPPPQSSLVRWSSPVRGSGTDPRGPSCTPTPTTTALRQPLPPPPPPPPSMRPEPARATGSAVQRRWSGSPRMRGSRGVSRNGDPPPPPTPPPPPPPLPAA